MIKLSRIVEQQGMDGQYYDLGKDFANFRRTIDGADEEIKKRFEQSIGEKLIGKRVRARASRGYKQYVKDYEFDIVKVTLDDYYDNYVVVAHDNTTPKPKEYFLKPGFKIQILGVATGQPSPQKGGKPEGLPQPSTTPSDSTPTQPTNAQHQPMTPAPIGNQPVKEADEKGYYDAYPIEEIVRDVEPWFKSSLIKPTTSMRDFIKEIGWQKEIARGTKVAMFDIKVPANALKIDLTPDHMTELFNQLNESGNKNVNFKLVKMKPNEARDVWEIRIKKTTTE